MSHAINGNANSFPTAITVPSDTDGPTLKASDVNVGFGGIADRTANINRRLVPVESAVRIVNLQAKISTASIDIPTLGVPGVPDGTRLQEAIIFSSGITTIVGDIVEVDLRGTGGFTFGPSASDSNGLFVEIFARQNGGSYVRHAYCKLGSSASDLTPNGTSTSGAVAAKAVFTITTAGTLDIKLRVSFDDATNPDDTATLLLYRATFLQYRGV